MTAALILAGTRRGGDPLAEAHGVSHKSLIEIGGRPMLERVISGVSEAGIARIAVSTDDAQVAQIAEAMGAQILAPRPGPSESVAAAIDVLGTPLVVTTSDHALLQAQWVRELLADAPAHIDVGIMLARRDQIETAMPGTRRTYLSFADGGWSGCNLFLLQTGKAAAAIDTWRMVEADRKRPWRIAARLGPTTLLAVLLRRLTLAEGIARLGRRIGIEAALIPARDGLAAVDVDKEADLMAVRRLLEAG